MIWTAFKYITRFSIILLGGIACGFLFTDDGNRWLIEQAALQYEIEVQGVKGSLRDELCVESLDYVTEPSLRISVNDLCVSVNLTTTLMSGQPRLASVSAGQLSVTTENLPSPTDEVLAPIEIPPMPLRAVVQQLTVDALQFNEQRIDDILVRNMRLSPLQTRLETLVFKTQDIAVETRLSMKQGLTRQSLQLQGSLTANMTNDKAVVEALSALNFSASGSPDNLAIEVTSKQGDIRGIVDITRPDWPFQTQLTLAPLSLADYGLNQNVNGNTTVTGDAQNLTFTGELISQDNSLQFSGSKAAEQLQLQIVFEDFPLVLEALAPQALESTLTGTVSIATNLAFDRLRIELAEMATPFTKSPVSGNADIELADSLVRVSKIRLTSGEGSLTGEADYRSVAQWQLTFIAEKLALGYSSSTFNDIYSEVSGAVALSADTAKIDLTLIDTGFDQLHLDQTRFQLNLQTDTWLRTEASGVSWGSDQELGDLTLQLTGELNESELSFRAGPAALTIAAEGHLARSAEQLTLTLEQLTASTDNPTIGPEPFIELATPSVMEWSTDAGLNGELALVNRLGGNAALVINTATDRGSLTLTQWQTPSYPVGFTGYSFSTLISGNLTTQALSTGTFTGSLLANELILTGLPESFPDLETEQGSLQFELQAQGQTSTMTLHGSIPELFEITGNASRDLNLDKTDANLQLRLLYPDLMAPFISPWGSRPTGSISANMQYQSSGSVEQLTGTAQWLNGSLDLETLGLTLNDITMSMDSGSAASITVLATAKDANGQPIDITGSIDNPLSANPEVQLSIRSTQAQLIDRTDARALVTSDVNYKYRQNIHQINGAIDVLEAKYTLSALPQTAILPSDDVEILGADPQQARQQLLMDLTINLSENTSFEAFGLKTDLSGRLNYLAAPGTPEALKGTLKTHKGTFGIYGQSLAITRGQLIFDGPLDDPLVDVIAKKDVRTDRQNYVIAVNVQGYASDLSTRITSTPTLPEADALSLLLTGQRLSDTSTENNFNVRSAGVNLGLSGTRFLTDRIVQKTGLDELTFSSTADDVEIGAGRQINDNLFLRYTYGSFSRIGGILIDYELTDNLRLRANTGDKESLEVQYIFPQ